MSNTELLFKVQFSQIIEQHIFPPIIMISNHLTIQMILLADVIQIFCEELVLPPHNNES